MEPRFGCANAGNIYGAHKAAAEYHGDLDTVQALRIDHEIRLPDLLKLKLRQVEDISDPMNIIAE
jgi:hypothetical protein